MSLHLVIPAAGSASRFGSSVPKQFLELNGTPLLVHSIRPFLDFNLDSCTVAVSEAYMDLAKKLLKPLACQINVVLGGNTRAESVKLAVQHIEKEAPVLIHDAARPFIDTALIQRVLTALKQHEAVIPAIACTDSIKVVKDNKVVQSLERQYLRRVQTPQGFHLSVLKQAYQAVSDITAFTDEGELVESLGILPAVVAGDERNRKVTFSDDLH